jgi:hypothetical protein
MLVDKNTEHYLLHSMKLSAAQIKKMLPSEIDEHCNQTIKQRIQDKSIYKPSKN